MSLNASTLTATLDRLGARLEEKHETLNWGGCCVYAAMIGQKLQELGVTCSVIVAGYGEGTNVEHVRANLSDAEAGSMQHWNRNGVYFGHVGVEFVIDGLVYHYDSSGTAKPGEHHGLRRQYAGRITVEDAAKLAATGRGWNPSFDRDQIPEIRKAVNRAFGKLKTRCDNRQKTLPFGVKPGVNASDRGDFRPSMAA